NALLWLNVWLRKYPDDWYAHYWRGAVYQHNIQPELALADYKDVLQAQPQEAGARLRLGLMLAASGFDFEEALGHLEIYAQDHPDDPDLLVGLARCQRGLHNHEEAQNLLEKVLQSHPDHVDALFLLALVEQETSRNEKALEVLKHLEPL